MARRAFTVLLASWLLVDAARGALLQWKTEGPSYPLDSPEPPVVLRPPSPWQPDVLVTLGPGPYGEEWVLQARVAESGRKLWTRPATGAAAASASPGAQLLLTAAGGGSAHPQNALNLALLLAGGTLAAYEPERGDVVWTYALPPAHRLKQASGWGDRLYLLLQHTSALADEAMPGLGLAAQLVALDAGTGAPSWATPTTALVPPTRAQEVQVPVESIAAGTRAAYFAKGRDLVAVAAADGRPLWREVVMLQGSGGGSGQGANVTSLAYVPPPPAANGSAAAGAGAPPRGRLPAGGLLVGADNWSFESFAVYDLRERVESSPVLLWRSRQQEQAVADPALAAPVASAADGLFFYWVNRTMWAADSAPESALYLAARRLRDGAEAWAQKASPASLPSAAYGRVFAPTTAGLTVLDAAYGSVAWSNGAVPTLERNGQEFGYSPAVVFGNATGQLVVMRCLGAEDPVRLCIYSSWDAEPPVYDRGGGGAPAGLIVGVIFAALAAGGAGWYAWRRWPGDKAAAAAAMETSGWVGQPDPEAAAPTADVVVIMADGQREDAFAKKYSARRV